MDDDVIRVAVCTNSHLGFKEKDPVRFDDSFAAFEETFKHARDDRADFVLHAGNMFHENRPSRRTLHSAMRVLRKYCWGEAPVHIEVVSETPVNYENPYESISLPVFAIHGSHDEPSYEGASALDLMAVSNFVNYYGKALAESILISPILIRKKGTHVALYGLGAVHDELLSRMWKEKKVRFAQPPHAEEYFNILVLHQTRAHESMIPDWMDLVIWGKENQCIPHLQDSLVGVFRNYQPGSSVATSLDKCSAAHSKYMACIHIRAKKYKLVTEPLTQVRPFLYRDLKLKDYPVDQEDQIQALLRDHVTDMIREARGTAKANKALMFCIKEPKKVLIRLRCDHTGFTSINPTRFGALFLDQVANASEVVSFFCKRKPLDNDEALTKIKMEDLVKEALVGKSLTIVKEKHLAIALMNAAVMHDAINATIKQHQDTLWTQDLNKQSTEQTPVMKMATVTKQGVKTTEQTPVMASCQTRLAIVSAVKSINALDDDSQCTATSAVYDSQADTSAVYDTATSAVYDSQADTYDSQIAGKKRAYEEESV